MGAPLTNAIIASAVRGSILLTAALLLVVLMRRASAARRHTILLGAIVAQLLIPLFGLVPAGITDALVPRSVAAKVATAESVVGLTPRVVATRSDLEPTAASDAVASSASLLPFTWMAGAFLFALWAIGGRVRVARMTSSALPESAVNVRDAAVSATRLLGERRPIRLLLTNAIRVPVTWGIFRPRIALPDDAPAWDSERLRLIMLHETAHIRRDDARAQLIGSIALVPFWFNPLLWLAVRQLRVAAERAADDLVIGAGVPASTYVDTLLELVQQLGSQWQPGVPLAMARRGEFEGRMMAVLDGSTDRTPSGRSSGMRWGVVTVAAAAILGIVRGPLPTASAAERGSASSPSGQQSASLTASLLTIAERMPDDIATGEELEHVIASGPLGGEEVDRYLAIVSRMRRPIARGSSIRALAGAVALDSARLVRALDLVAGVSSPIERSITLASIARTQTLGAAHRAQYHAIASSLRGPPLTSALEALRR